MLPTSRVSMRRNRQQSFDTNEVTAIGRLSNDRRSPRDAASVKALQAALGPSRLGPVTHRHDAVPPDESRCDGTL